MNFFVRAIRAKSQTLSFPLDTARDKLPDLKSKPCILPGDDGGNKKSPYAYGALIWHFRHHQPYVLLTTLLHVKCCVSLNARGQEFMCALPRS